MALTKMGIVERIQEELGFIGNKSLDKNAHPNEHLMTHPKLKIALQNEPRIHNHLRTESSSVSHYVIY